MKFPVLLLWITAALFMAFGLGFAFAPEALADLVAGDAPSVASAVTDMRATYGGVAIGLGLFYGMCARRPEWVRLGLIASLIVVASIGATRLGGIIADGSPNAFMIIFLVAELLSVGLYAFALGQLGRSQGDDSQPASE